MKWLFALSVIAGGIAFAPNATADPDVCYYDNSGNCWPNSDLAFCANLGPQWAGIPDCMAYGQGSPG